GRRRHDARSFADSLRQQHEQQQRAQSLSSADVDGGRLEDGKGRATPGDAGAYAAGERAVDHARSRGHFAGQARRQHWKSLRGLKMKFAILVLAAVSMQAADSPLANAIKSGQRAAAVDLIAKKADVNAAEADGTTPLIWAASLNDADLTARLLK